MSEPARKYAIVKELDEPADLKEGTTVLQFETRLHNGLECGGAYLKFLRPQEAGWKPKELKSAVLAEVSRECLFTSQLVPSCYLCYISLLFRLSSLDPVSCSVLCFL